MNILVEQLPEYIEVDGREYKIATDFRTCIRVILAFEDDQLTAYEKQMVMLSALYPQAPDNIEAAIRQAMKFLNGGELEEDEGDETPMRLYSFDKDSGLIFAAFRQSHGIDIETSDMHWWKFLALFMDLGSETAFCNLVGLRKRLKTGKATKEERAAAREMGDLIDLPEPDTRTLEEREREAIFMSTVQQGKV